MEWAYINVVMRFEERSSHACMSQSLPISADICREKRLTIGKNRHIVPHITGKTRWHFSVLPS